MRLGSLILAGLLVSSCAAVPQSASSPYCEDWARVNSRLYGVHYSISEVLDDQDALRAWCMRNLQQP